jgi:glycosyltransferase involved in cell wall biosynthesis
MISVIIPNYNGAKFLREAIDSALSQTGVGVEVIVVDDGSTDDSRGIIESYGDSIRSLFQDNLGACAARNAGLGIAQGEYVKFLDSDDILLSYVLAEQSSALLEGSGKCIVYGNAILTDQDGAVLTPLYLTEMEAGKEAPVEEMICRSPLTSMPLHRASFLREVGGFDPRMPAGQEYDLHLRLYFNGVRFIYQPTVCYEYRQHTAATRISTKRHSVESLEQRFEGYQQHLRLAEESFGQPLPESVKGAFAHVFWDTGRFAVRCDHLVIAKCYFSTAERLTSCKYISGGRGYQFICRLLGPIRAEQLLMRLRSLIRPASSNG